MTGTGARMPTPRLVAFDLDDTLAPSKSAIDPRIGELLIALAERVDVAIISGGQLAQFTHAGRRPAPGCRARRRSHGSTCCPPAARSTTASRRTASTTVYALRADRRPEVARARRRRGRGPPSRTLGVRDVGRHPRGPRLADHLLGARPARSARREDRLGPDRREEEHAARGGGRSASPTSRCAPAARRRSTSPTRASTRPTACASSPSRPASRSRTCSSSATASTPTATTTRCSRWACACHAVEGWEDTAEFLERLIPTLPAR